MYYISSVQLKFPFLFHKSIQNYLGMADAVIMNHKKLNNEKIVKCALILLKKVLGTQEYFIRPKKFTQRPEHKGTFAEIKQQ